MRGPGPVSRWLDGLASWQFAALMASCLLATYAVMGAIIWLTARHPNLSFLVGYAIIFTIFSTVGATWSRHRRRIGR